MKKIIKILLCALLAGLLTAAAFPLPASAADPGGSCGAKLNWTFERASGTLTLTGSGAMTAYASPAAVPWSDFNAEIRVVSLPAGLTEISAYAFSACRLVKAPVLPASLTSIGDEAFAYSNVPEIEIPAGVTKIGRDVFLGCASLSAIRAAAKNTVYSAAGNCLIEKKTGKLIAGCRASVIPKDGSVKSIGERAFYAVPLAEAALPASVTEIGKEAFYGTALTAVTIPAAVTKIGAGAFAGCRFLTSFAVEKGNRHYRAEGGSVIESPGEVLVCGSAASVIPSGVRKIADSAFADCADLRSVSLPDSVTEIGNRAFWNCVNLASVRLPAGLTSVGEYAFAWCEKLTLVEFPDQLTAIGRGAFLGCSAVTEISVPAALATIGDAAFYGCDGLQTVVNRGTDASYAAITVGAENDPFLNARVTGAPAPSVLWGDADGDGSVLTKDLALMRGYLANLDPTTGLSAVTLKAGADCNGDGAVNMRDLALLRGYLANLDPVTGQSIVVLGPAA